MHQLPLVSVAQMRRLEAASVQRGATWAELMVDAGRGVADWALTLLDSAVGAAVLVLVGPGNNGGDALVVARHGHEAGANVTLYVWQRTPNDDDWPWYAALDEGLPVVWARDDHNLRQLSRLAQAASLIVDGLLGSGVTRPISAELGAIVDVVNAASAPIVAIDVPSGLNADSGAIWGAIIDADLTVATGLPKRGHHLFPGAAFVGRLVVAPLDLPTETEKFMATELNLETLRSLLPIRPADSHKDTFGRVLVVAGSYFYPGAAWLATTAATRSGAGVVTLACPRSIYGSTAATLHEATYLPLPEKEPGALSESAAKIVLEKIGKYRALLIGPGVGTEDSTGDFLRSVLHLGSARRKMSVGFMNTPKPDDESPKRKAAVGFGMPVSKREEPTAEEAEAAALPPVVLDADGLNLLAKIEGWSDKLREHPTILTPHHGEMARLLGVETLGDDHPQVAADAAQQWGVVVVLKGAHTIIAAPDGRVTIHGVANTALATAGSGDVLAGLTAGLLAQGLAPYEAAQLAVGVHGVAGGIVREQLGERGVVAGDLLARLPLAWQRIAG